MPADEGRVGPAARTRAALRLPSTPVCRPARAPDDADNGGARGFHARHKRGKRVAHVDEDVDPAAEGG